MECRTKGGERCSFNDINIAANAMNSINDTMGWGNQVNATINGLKGNVNYNCAPENVVCFPTNSLCGNGSYDFFEARGQNNRD